MHSIYKPDILISDFIRFHIELASHVYPLLDSHHPPGSGYPTLPFCVFCFRPWPAAAPRLPEEWLGKNLKKIPCQVSTGTRSRYQGHYSNLGSTSQCIYLHQYLHSLPSNAEFTHRTQRRASSKALRIRSTESCSFGRKWWLARVSGWFDRDRWTNRDIGRV